MTPSFDHGALLALGKSEANSLHEPRVGDLLPFTAFDRRDKTRHRQVHKRHDFGVELDLEERFIEDESQRCQATLQYHPRRPRLWPQREAQAARIRREQLADT